MNDKRVFSPDADPTNADWPKRTPDPLSGLLDSGGAKWQDFKAAFFFYCGGLDLYPR